MFIFMVQVNMIINKFDSLFFLEEAEAVYAMHVQFLHEKQL